MSISTVQKIMEDLIKSVKKHRPLWDTSIKSYKDQTKRLHAWNMVSKECRLSKESAKSKWKGLRDTYLKSLKKRKKYCNAELMSFMEPLISNLISRTAIDQPTEIVEVSQPSAIVNNGQEAATECPPEKDSVKCTESNNDYPECPWKSSVEQTDATDMLFLSYSKTLQSFSKRRQILLKNKIAVLFLHAELGEITEVKGNYITACDITPRGPFTADNDNLPSSHFDLLATTPCSIDIYQRPNNNH